jgi:hypothetical protein
MNTTSWKEVVLVFLLAASCSTETTVTPGAPCGGISGARCPQGMFCDFEPNNCGAGDAAGICMPMPQLCPAECSRACGCDGKVYCNLCNAHGYGVDDSDDRSCLDGGRD